MRQPLVHRLCGTVVALACLLGATQCRSLELPSGVQEKLDLSKSPEAAIMDRRSAARSLADDWKETLPGLVQSIGLYYMAESKPPYRDTDVPSLIALTDILRTIIVNREGAIQAFREADNNNTIELLTWAARGTNESLRSNATYILASVVDNTNLCIILDHLRDPELSPEGRANLIQAATPPASYAFKENVADVEKTANIVRPLAITPPLPYLLNTLEVRTMNSLNRDTPFPSGQGPLCDYKPMFSPPDAIPQAVPAPVAPSP